jgi:hypothetical protein
MPQDHAKSDRPVVAYKLFRRRRDGSLGPLFINRKLRVPLNQWLEAESCPTRGYALRPGWHCTLQPIAPHLSTRGRVWCQVEVQGVEEFRRPASQGGAWLLARRLRVLGPVTSSGRGLRSRCCARSG